MDYVNKSNTERKEHLFENIHFADLAYQFETVLHRVKELDLHYLIEPIQSAATKLRQLDRVAENLTCDYYDNYTCLNKDCCNDIDLPKLIESKQSKVCDYYKNTTCKNEECCNDTNITESKKSIDTAPSQIPLIGNGQITSSRYSIDSCKCVNSFGVKSCHCGSEEDATVDKNHLHKTETFCVVKKSDEVRCNPCKCKADLTGKKIKTLDCKLAAIERKRRRKERKTKCCNLETQTRADDKLDDGVIIERRISNSRLMVQTNLKTLSLTVEKENTVVEDATRVKLPRVNQGILCNLSSESSFTEYESDYSSDDIFCSKSCEDCLNNNTRVSMSKDYLLQYCGCVDEKNECTTSYSNLSSCGCGHEVVNENEIRVCPCGCGDMMDLSTKKCVRKSLCQCENCGKEIIERWPSQVTKQRVINTEKPVPFNDSAFAQKPQLKKRQLYEKIQVDDKLPPDKHGIPYADTKMYIKVLEEKCHEKDKIISELTKELSEKIDPTECGGYNLPAYIN